MKNILFLFLVAVMAFSCDPMRRINMKNESNEDAEITWFIKEDSILSSPFFISNSQEVNFQLGTRPGSNHVKMSFGTGTWSDKTVTNLIDDLDSVILKWNHKVAVLNTDSQMKDFLMARRKGIDKSKIQIILKKEDDNP